MTTLRTLAALLRVGRPSAARVALSVALGSITVLAGVGLMATAGYLISRAAERPPILSLTVAIVAVRACGIGRPVARYFDRLESHDLAFRALTRIRAAFYRKLEPLVPARTEQHRQGDLLARMVGDVDAMQNLLLRGVTPPLVWAATGAVSVAVTAVILPAAALVLASGLAVGGLAVPFVAAVAGRRLNGRQVKVRAELTAELVELLRGAPELVVLGADEAALARIRRLDGELTRLARADAVVAGMVEGLGTLVAGLTVVGALAVSVSATAGGGLDHVMVAALALLAMAVFEAVTPLPAAALTLNTTLAAGERLLAVMARRPAVPDPARPAPPPTETTASLERVTYDYPAGGAWGLRDVDLDLAPRRRLALVGQSGAGKTTVAELLVRFMDPGAGRVTLGGADLRALRQHAVRSAITLDRQDAYLFATTIKENVRLARPDAGDEEIREALRRARVWDWVASLPDGWDTFVGEEGVQVSGGERRRITLARAFLARTPVLVLDEPTAHLDPPTADALIADVLADGDGRSLLLITHHTTWLDAVDQVVRLRRGRVTPRR
ncbi:MAG TPA: thiol reductant ABC exporter subunit CydC [Gaiellales bacterium]|jgi:thiol reductant ABC exporter CydC subunit|nr:thiol reductant ABC exporter subunit CydC [Gaiellales bacterium]